MAVRKGVCNRNTSETQIQCEINLDGTGNATVDTGIGFFDHMLKSFAKHGLFDLKIKVKGDLFVDSHHTIEDTGIVLGEAFYQWTKPWCYVPLIYLIVLFLYTMQI